MDGLEQALRDVRFAVFDFDGVFTDNHVWVNGDGAETVRCSRADGFGLRRLEEVGVGSLILSTETAPVVSARSSKLRVECLQGVTDKLRVLREEAAVRGVSLEQTAYVGNDVNDVECLRAVGLPVVPADAWPEVRHLARLVLSRNGGDGCVREFCDAVWFAQGGGA